MAQGQYLFYPKRELVEKKISNQYGGLDLRLKRHKRRKKGRIADYLLGTVVIAMPAERESLNFSSWKPGQLA
jgi:hypothetical protein